MSIYFFAAYIRKNCLKVVMVINARLFTGTIPTKVWWRPWALLMSAGYQKWWRWGVILIRYKLIVPLWRSQKTITKVQSEKMSYNFNNSSSTSAARVPYPGDPHSYYSFAAQALSKGGLTPMQQQALYQQQMNAYQQHYGAGTYNSTPSIPYGKFSIDMLIRLTLLAKVEKTSIICVFLGSAKVFRSFIPFEPVPDYSN